MEQIPYYIWAESKGRLIRFLVTDKGLNTPSDKSKLVKERGEKSRRELHSLYTNRAAWELGPECKPNSSFLQLGRYPRPGTALFTLPNTHTALRPLPVLQGDSEYLHTESGAPRQQQ